MLQPMVVRCISSAMKIQGVRTLGGGSLFGYHQFVEIDKAGPFLSIKWVPLILLKTYCSLVHSYQRERKTTNDE